MIEKKITITVTQDEKGVMTVGREVEGFNRFELIGLLYDAILEVQSGPKEHKQ